MIEWQKKLRLYSGLVLFAFAAGHFTNHALGLVSIDAMETMQGIRIALWRSIPGTALLYGSLLVHVFLVLKKFAQRRSWQMSRWEAVQLAFGLLIPVFLLGHIMATRMVYQRFGVNDDYTYALSMMWPGAAITQSVLLILVWVHGCIGLYFLLRLKAWFPRVSLLLHSIAVLLPVLAIAGFTVSARQVYRQVEGQKPLTAEQIDVFRSAGDMAVDLFLAVAGTVIVYRLIRTVSDRFGPKIKIQYAGNRTVTTQAGATLLDISRMHGVPHASVCGGRARCSTCRVRILEGIDQLPAADEAELKVLRRVGAGSNVRLACQLIPKTDISVATLLPAQRISVSDVARQDRYLWGIDQTVTLLFADIRGFTAMSEAKLPYDVVFVLNQYLGKMSEVISESGGYVDKFIGDGIMAIFGMDRSVDQGARDALAAARVMSETLDDLNKSLAADLDKPLTIGIGIHTGPAILGRIGVSDAVGAMQRITALGDTVNTASRLESSCKDLGCQLIVSEKTVKLSESAVSGSRPELISVKGREEKVPIHVFRSARDLMMTVPDAVAAS